MEPRQGKGHSRPVARRGRLLALAKAWVTIGPAILSGCRHAAAPMNVETTVPEVAITRPERTPLRWTVRQPGYIEAYEETPIVPKIAGYVEKWNVDIGDRVEKGQELAKLWVPDLVAQLERRKAEVDQAREMLAVAEAHLSSAGAAIDEARAGVGRAKADLAFQQIQHGRATELRRRSVVIKEVEDEVTNQVRSAEASIQEAEARVARAEAARRESAAVQNKARVDIAVAEAALAETKALVGYATLPAPYDGVVARRRINTGDFVQPASGAPQNPLYVIQRRDLMRIFVEVPESDAVWVKEGTPARIRIPILPDREFDGTVRRISYSLKRQTRTLLAEIDIPNPEDLLRPGMYAAATLRVERTGLLTLPRSAVASEGNVNEGYRDFCYLLEGDRLRRTRIEVGARGEDRIQVLKKEVEGQWTEFRGDEAIVVGELATLADGQEVRIARRRKEPAADWSDVGWARPIGGHPGSCPAGMEEDHLGRASSPDSVRSVRRE